MTLFTKLASLALVPICAAGYVTQATAADNGALTITLENDLLTGSDNNYTNGLGVSWVSGDLESYDDDKFVSKWSRFWEFLPFVGDEGYSTYASWTVAQEMHTPDDITIPNPPADDQPYAGVLYIDSVLYARNGALGTCLGAQTGRGRTRLAGRRRTEGDPRPRRWR